MPWHSFRIASYFNKISYNQGKNSPRTLESNSKDPKNRLHIPIIYQEINISKSGWHPAKKHHGRWLDDQVPNFYGKPCPSRATNECHLHSRSSPGAIRQHPGWSRRGARTELFKKQWTFLYPICSMVLVYLPTKLGDLCKAHVGKYSSTMEHMGIFCWEMGLSNFHLMVFLLRKRSYLWAIVYGKFPCCGETV